MRFDIHDDTAVEKDGTVYAVIADPQECDITVDADHDALICTGDMLYLAPPPGAESLDGSLIAEYGENAEELYGNGDVTGILEEVSHISSNPDVKKAATERYRAFFEGIETDFYYVLGNQDIPDAVHTAVAEYGHVRHVNELDGFAGIDGIVPSFADVPDGYFPVEICSETFYERANRTDEPVLVAHSIGEEDAESLGFEAVLASKDDREEHQVTEDTARLASHAEGDYVLLLT